MDRDAAQPPDLPGGRAHDLGGRDLPAIPFIRVPDATEGDVQKATDIGALGVIVPMVVEPEKVEAAVRFAKYPPVGARSLGGGQYGELWGSDYRQTANDNIMVVGMIESPAGVENVDRIATIPGVDVIFTAADGSLQLLGIRPGHTGIRSHGHQDSRHHPRRRAAVSADPCSGETAKGSAFSRHRRQRCLSDAARETS